MQDHLERCHIFLVTVMLYCLTQLTEQCSKSLQSSYEVTAPSFASSCCILLLLSCSCFMHWTKHCSELQSCCEMTAMSFARPCGRFFLSTTAVIQGHWQSSALQACAKVVAVTVQACKPMWGNVLLVTVHVYGLMPFTALMHLTAQCGKALQSWLRRLP